MVSKRSDSSTKKKETNIKKAAGTIQKMTIISSQNKATTTTNAAVKAYTITHRLPDFIHEFNSIPTQQQHQAECQNQTNNMVSVTGQVQSIRGLRKQRANNNKKSQTIFYDIHGDGAKLQLLVSPKNDYHAVGNDSILAFNDIKAMVKIGDTIGVSGYAGRTKGGILSIFVVELVVLDSSCSNVLSDGANGDESQEGGNASNTITQREQKSQIGCDGKKKRKRERKKRSVCIEDESKQNDAVLTGKSITSNNVEQLMPVTEEVVQNDISPVRRVEVTPIHETAQPPLSTKDAPEKKMEANVVNTAAKKKKAKDNAERRDATMDSIKAYISHRLPDFISKYNPITKLDTRLKQNVVAVAGRVTSIREQGKKKPVFYDIYADGAKLQLMASLKDYRAGAEGFRISTAMIKIGDTIGARGYAGKTKGGKLSVFVTELVVFNDLSRQDMLSNGANAGDQGSKVDNTKQSGQKSKSGCESESGKKSKQRKSHDACTEDESKQNDASSNKSPAEVSLTSNNSEDQSLPALNVEVDETDLSPIPKIQSTNADEVGLTNHKEAKKEATNADVEGYNSRRLPDFISKYNPITKPGTRLTENIVTVAGRVKSIRERAKQLVNYDIHEGGAKLQLVASVKDFTAGAKSFSKITAKIKIGDIINAHGYVGKSSGKTLSVFVTKLAVSDASSRQDMLPEGTNTGGQGGKADYTMHEEHASQIVNHNVCTEDESKQKDASSTDSSTEVAVTSNNNSENEAIQNSVFAATTEGVLLEETDLSPILSFQEEQKSQVACGSGKMDIQHDMQVAVLEKDCKQNDASSTGSSAEVMAKSNNNENENDAIQNSVLAAATEEVLLEETGHPPLSTNTISKLEDNGAMKEKEKTTLDAAKDVVEGTVLMQQRSQQQRQSKLGLRPGGSVYTFSTPAQDDEHTCGISENELKEEGTPGLSVTAASNNSEDRSLPDNEGFQDVTPLGETDQLMSNNSPKSEFEAEASNIANVRLSRRRKKPEMTVNSRALLWASYDEEKREQTKKKNIGGEGAEKYSSNGGRTNTTKRNIVRCEDQEDDMGNTTDDSNEYYSNGRGGAMETSKSAWAAARAQRKQSGRDNRSIIENIASGKGEKDDLLTSLRSARASTESKIRATAYNAANSVSSRIRIRDEWEKNDNGYTKTKLEEDMEILLESINGTEVGLLSSTIANLPIELPDGEGGSIATVQDQILAEAAAKVMRSWSHRVKWTRNECRICGQILLRMEKEEVLGEGAVVDKQDYLAVINAYAKITAEDETASIRAENLLDHMEKRAAEGRIDLAPDRLLINTVMGAHAKHSLSGDLSMNSISAAERMLATLEREYARGDNTMQPTARTYSKFIDLYAKNGLSDKAVTALDRMENQYRRGNKAALPNTIHYTNVIDSLAKSASSSSTAARTAEKILRSMLDLYDKGLRHLAPDTIIFSATIDAYAKSGRHDASERSLAILDLMNEYSIVPDIIIYNTLLNTLGRSPNYQYLSTSKDILHYIEESPYLRADQFTYNSIIKGAPPKDAENLIQVRLS